MAKPRTLLLVASRLLPSGPLRYLSGLVRGLCARRHVVHVLSAGGTHAAAMERRGASVHLAPAWGTPWSNPDAVSVGRALRAVRGAGVEMVHAVDPGRSGEAAHLARSLRTPWVTTAHVFGTSEAPGVAPSCDAVLAVSESLRQALVHRGRLDKESIHVVPYGVETARYPAPPPSETARPTPTIGALGRLSAEKGIADLLAAVRLLLDRGRDLEALVAGDGPELGRLRAQVRRLRLTRRVTFALAPPPPAELLPSIDVFVQPNVREGLDLELLDAMACARPVVACAGGGIQEVVRDEETGFLVRPRDPEALADRIGRLLDDTALRDRLGLAARERIEQDFPLERMIRRTEAVYEQVRSGSLRRSVRRRGAWRRSALW